LSPSALAKGLTCDLKGPLSKGLEASDAVWAAAYGKRQRREFKQTTGAARRDRAGDLDGLEFRGSQLAAIQDEVHANWGRLTSAHLDLIACRRARLASKIKEAYGITGDEAERQIKSFEVRNQHPRPVSFR
jgi:uncharacterized protein YjbJ (UPF0337 family)